MKKWIAVAGMLLFMGASCNKPPDPTPGPTPPTPTPAVSMLLRSANSTFVDLTGQLVRLFMAVQCCDAIPGVANSRWPLISKEAMDYYHGFGANMFHMRLGPFYARCTDENNPACGEVEWADVGGAYLADGSFNQAFFDKVEQLVAYARSQNFYVEVNIIDTWYCKHAQWGDVQMPWPQAAVAACGRTAGDPTQTAYVNKVVSTLNKYDNVIWLLDNEGDLIQGNQQVWWTWQIQTIRAAEAASGSINVHLIGANPQRLPGADYAYTHARAALVDPIAGLPTINNERNPSFSPNQEAANFKGALAKGLVYAYWRDGATEDASVQTLTAFKAVWDGSTPQIACYAPDGEDPLWDPNPSPGTGGRDATAERNAIKAAESETGSVCGQDPPSSLETLAQRVRAKGFCASKNSDSVFVMQGQYGFEFHAVAYGNGCWTSDQAVNPKNTWRYTGTAPTPPVACTDPQPPPVDHFNIKIHNTGPSWTTVDSTPIIHNAAYCAAAGFPGNLDCPLRAENDPTRSACEVVAVGAPVWTGPGEVSPEGPYLYRVRRGTSGDAKVCASKYPATCGTIHVQP